MGKVIPLPKSEFDKFLDDLMAKKNEITEFVCIYATKDATKDLNKLVYTFWFGNDLFSAIFVRGLLRVLDDILAEAITDTYRPFQ